LQELVRHEEDLLAKKGGRHRTLTKGPCFGLYKVLEKILATLND